METGRDTNFEQMDKQTLADTLKIFYPAARQKKQDEENKPKLYSKL